MHFFELQFQQDKTTVSFIDPNDPNKAAQVRSYRHTRMCTKRIARTRPHPRVGRVVQSGAQGRVCIPRSRLMYSAFTSLNIFPPFCSASPSSVAPSMSHWLAIAYNCFASLCDSIPWALALLLRSFTTRLSSGKMDPPKLMYARRRLCKAITIRSYVGRSDILKTG